MFGIKYALKIAKEYYDEKTFHHAMRVAGYVAQDNLIPKGVGKTNNRNELAHRFNVSSQLIYKIYKREIWKHIE